MEVKNTGGFTPMMQQYIDIKRQHEDCILMYRLGDFYEMFFDDAETASRELDLILTGRDCGQPERAPMCGVPYHSAEGYIARLIAKGYKVAICEQTEDPAKAKGLVRREVVRMITPGTVIESSMLSEGQNNYISAVYMDSLGCGTAFCDISTGEFWAADCGAADSAEHVLNEFGKFEPREVVMSDSACSNKPVMDFAQNRLGCHVEHGGEWRFIFETALSVLREQFPQAEHAELASREHLVRAVGGLLSYLHETQKSKLPYINKLRIYSSKQFMELDYNARRNLEITRSLHTGDKKGSLLWVLDHTKTAMGARLIRQWLEKPLVDRVQIQSRQNGVKAFLDEPQLSDSIAEELGHVYDIERIMTRISYGSANGRDLRSLEQVCRVLPAVKKMLGGLGSRYMRALADKIDTLDDIAQLIDRAIVEKPPFSVREGGMIEKGFDAEADRLRDLLSGGAGRILEIERRERERTGITKLKTGYNRVFGYYIEVSRGQTAQVPEDYIRKQTLANCERYITPELKELEGEVLSASDRLTALEYELFCGVRDAVAAEAERVRASAQAVAEADVLRSFAEAAARYNYCMPEVDDSDRIEIRDGRHPIVERAPEGGLFVPNDTLLDGGDNRVYIITGPNMAGKSTFMRQVALITLMAQCGSFVPAASASVGICDRIFTRVGASDDMFGGRSTFMVEMNEVTEILRNATRRSLLILDEIGRGTSTFDGMAIARAVLEYVADKGSVGAKTLFATHYHELCEMEGVISGVKNYNIVVKKRGEEIIFIKKIVPGGASDSYGIDVARLAGLPEKVIRRAKTLLTEIEQRSAGSRESRTAPPQHAEEQFSMAGMAQADIVKRLKELQPDTLTPIEALTFLYEISKEAKEC